MIDDSIVRGTTLRKLVRMIKGQGAKEVHVRIGSPAVVGSCYYGIDTPTKEELIANKMTIDGIKDHINADSLTYFKVDDFKDVLQKPEKFCNACFTCNYIYTPEKDG